MAGKHVRSRYFCDDRITNLPCNVLECILARLPLRDAVRTSILSRQWKHNWLMISCLVFDQEFAAPLDGKYDLDYTIYHVLLSHPGPIVKFVFDFRKALKIHSIDHWLHILSNQPRVETLRRKLWNHGHRHLIPQYMLWCQRLMHLSLKYVRFPDTFKGFTRLVSLDLEDVSDVHKVLITFTSKCPVLEHLSLKNHKDIVRRCLDIRAPNLKSFHFYGICGSICFVTPGLEEIWMANHKYARYGGRGGLFYNFGRGDSRRSNSNMDEFFSQVRSIKRAVLHDSFLSFLALGGVPQKHSYSLYHLTLLNLKDICLECKDPITVGLCFIRSAPNLRCLKISLNRCSMEESAAIQYLKEQQECEDPLSCSLRNAAITNSEGGEAEVEFVKLLLLRANVLEEMEIELGSKVKLRTEHVNEMVAKLQGFPWASLKVTVTLNRSCEGVMSLNNIHAVN